MSATVADREILGWRTQQNAEEEVAYRSDLARAVRPISEPKAEPISPPAKAETSPVQPAENPAEPEPQPLVLGSEERISALALGAETLAPQSDMDESFSQFAERTGANGLGDLLEAAAAYTGEIQGSRQFSRPQIMKHVADFTNDRYSREDGLRSFGILLRQGKIQKLKRGLFVLSEQSRYTQTNRLAGE